MSDYFEKPKNLIPWWAIVAMIIVCLFALRADAHPLDDLDDWYLDWRARTEQGLTADLIAEVSDMMDRHPDYIPPAFRIPATAPQQPDSHAPVTTGMGNRSSDVEQWRGLVSQYFADVDRALCVIAHESGGNPDARNPSGASGLFQVMPFWFGQFGGSAFDPTNNVRVASLVLAEQGWTAWSVVKKGYC